MDRDNIAKLAEKLLDISKRNNLISFKDTKASTGDIAYPDIFKLFSKIKNGGKVEVFDPKEIEEEEFDIEYQEEQDIPETLSKDEYIAKYSQSIKKNQILVYNQANKPIAAIKNISKKARTTIEETGINAAYMTFGFVIWTDSDSSNVKSKAPVLLVPIKIVNKRTIDPHYIEVIDDDIVLNPTFAHKLYTEHGVELPQYDEDMDLREYLDSIAKLLSKLNWKVTYESRVGIFSFQKLNMYNDLVANNSKILANKNIQAMVDGANFDGGMSISSQQQPQPLVNVVDADASQTEAIELVNQGKSFVLQGPPGTGKSQTITNIIAECLYRDKSVLFVSEKLAALTVVSNKLDKAGLSEFCLELHSHKSNKKDVVAELCRTLKLPKTQLTASADRELHDKINKQAILDEYAQQLHRVRPVIDKTLYNIYDEISACRNNADVQFCIDDISSKDSSYIDQAENLLAKYCSYIDSIGKNYKNHVWYGYSGRSFTYQERVALTRDLNTIVAMCNELSSISGELHYAYGLAVLSIDSANTIKEFLACVSQHKYTSLELLIERRATKAIAQLSQLKQLSEDIADNNALLKQLYEEDILALDGAKLYKSLTKLHSNAFKRLFSKEYKEIIKSIKLCLHTNGKVSYKKACSSMHTLSQLQHDNAQFDTVAKLVQPYMLCTLTQKLDFDSCIQECDNIKKFASVDVLTNCFGRMPSSDYVQARANMNKLSKQLQQCFDNSDRAECRVADKFDKQVYDIMSIDVRTLSSKIGCLLGATDSLDNWCDFYRLYLDLDSYGLIDYIDCAIGNNLDADTIVGSYKKVFYRQWADYILHGVPNLTELSRIAHDQVVAQYCAKDKLSFEINKSKIRTSLSRKKPNMDMVLPGSGAGILLHEGSKKRKIKGVRKLLSEIGDFVQVLKPCFLMSPLSVSTFLSPDMHFDVVVFDEASQIHTEDAIGSLYRAQQAIIVGDSKQMPPSNFFNSVGDSNDDQEDETLSDYESVLDLCSASYANARLKWHYRSKNEQLIAFSNKNFYDNELVTFPSCDSVGASVGVDYVYVQGLFDRTSKTNRNEAEAIVKLVFEHFEQHPDRSLGVVAFSQSQQNLIELLINKHRQKDASKEEYFDLERDEPFFVKNLETVQGDERDSIIFSIAYGYDAQGRFYHNFGPLTREGGERRLNVAITRAKRNVKVVASVHHTDFDLSKTNSVGARLLRDYIDYAENGEIALARQMVLNKYEQYDSEFEMEVCDYLRSRGFAVDTQVGCSSYKIDLAVKVANTSRYVLAIECDGASYHSSRSARDRDRLRQEVLESMGWKFYRIWSTDWFKNKSTEKSRLYQAVSHALDANAKYQEDAVAATTNDKPIFQVIAEQKKFQFPKYKFANERSFSGLVDVVHGILSVEAPISKDALLKRIAYVFDREIVNKVVRSGYAQYRYSLQLKGVVEKKGFVYLEGKEIPMLRIMPAGKTRSITDIAVEELAKGLCELVRQNITCTKDSLYKSIVEHLGFARTTKSMTDHLDLALSYASPILNVDADIVSLKQ